MTQQRTRKKPWFMSKRFMNTNAGRKYWDKIPMKSPYAPSEVVVRHVGDRPSSTPRRRTSMESIRTR